MVRRGEVMRGVVRRGVVRRGDERRGEEKGVDKLKRKEEKIISGLDRMGRKSLEEIRYGDTLV